MKKVTCIVLLLAMMLGLSGCGKKEVPEELKEAIDEAEKVLVKQYTRNSDKDFWSSAVTAATLVSETVESWREYTVVFELETSGGKRFAIEQHQTAGTIDSMWRELCMEQILIELVSDKNVEDAQEADEEVRVYSVTLLSPEYDDDGSGVGVREYSDFDADGKWDYHGYSTE